MKLELFVATTILITASIATFAARSSRLPTIEEVQKVVKTISGDKKKLQAYCELGRLQQQMEEAEEKNDTKLIDDLFAKADSLEQQLGPDYATIVDGIGDVDPNSEEGKKFTALFAPLHKHCE